MSKKKKKKFKSEVEKVWLIAYVNAEHIGRVNKELSKFDGIEAYIPTIKILKKNFKNKPHFEYVPLLFNYGFFKIPKHMAYNQDFLAKLKDQISCIYGWVKDTSKMEVYARSTAKEKKDNAPVGIATEQEIVELLKIQEDLTIFNSKQLETLGPGSWITLQGYPFEGVQAEIKSIDYKRKKVEVCLDTVDTGLLSKVIVNFENVFYTIYKGHDDSLSSLVSLDEVYKSKKINQIYAKFSEE